MNRQRPNDRQGHDRVLELAATAVDFDLTSAESRELETHLATCSACVRRVAAVRADARMLSRPLTLLPSSRVDAAVHAALAPPVVRPRRVLIMVAAVLLLVALLGTLAAGASLLRDRQTLPTTVVPNPSAPVAIATPVPDATPLVVGETWGTLDFPAYTPGALIEAAMFTGTDLVGVGRGGCVPDLNDPAECYGSAWIAADGEGWSRVPDQAGLGVGLTVVTIGPPKGIFDVAMGPAGIIAIGHQYGGIGPGIWRSQDGRTWQRVELGFNGADAHFAAIAASPLGYVIVGREVDFGLRAARAAAWASIDGVTWTRAADAAGMDVGPCLDTGEEPDCGGMLGIAASGQGFVAVGQGRSGAGEQSHPAAWTSTDGFSWTRSDAGLDFDGLLSGVTPGGAGFVAIGTMCPASCLDVAGVAATSPDGSIWTFSSVAGATHLRGVASIGDGDQVFALGTPSEGPGLELWRSHDGVAWQPLPDLPSIPGAVAYGAADIAAADDRLVVVGWAEVSTADGLQNFAYVSPLAASSATPTDGPSPTPIGAALPIPRCPAPQRQVIPPVVSVSAGDSQVVAATLGSYTTSTCTTTGTVDAVPREPESSLAVYPGDTLTMTLPEGWRFVRWEGSHRPIRGEGGGRWRPVSLAAAARSIDLPGPVLFDETVSLTTVLVSDDERAVIELSLEFVVNRAVS